MSNLHQERGFIHLSYIIPVVLLLGIILGVYLISQKTNLTPKASLSEPTNPQVSLSAISSKTTYQVGDAIQVKLIAKSDFDEANLFVARLEYSKGSLELVSIDKDATIIKRWPEEFSDPAAGTISLIGGVYNPGYKTTPDNPLVLATLNFKAKTLGPASVSFQANSKIHRNTDGQNILGSKNNLSLNIRSIPAESSPAPTPSANPTPSPIPSPSLQPSPTPPPAPCNLTSASWDSTVNPVADGAIVNVKVQGTGGCEGKLVKFEVQEDSADNFFVPAQGVGAPTQAVFNASNTAQSSWVAVFQQDGPFGISNPPEYNFTALLIEESGSISSSAPAIKVSKTSPSQFKNGDANNDGKIDLADLSLIFSNWDKSRGFPKELDINQDGEINTFDYSGLLLILQQNGVLKQTSP